MKKLLFLLTVVLSLALFSGVLAADNYCLMDDYGCYVVEDDAQTYIMFWSEAARKTIMGSLSSPGDLVVAKPANHSDKLPLDPGIAGSGSTSSHGLTDPISGTDCVAAVNWAMKALQDDPTQSYTGTQAQCLVDLQAAIASQISKHPNAETVYYCFYNSILNNLSLPMTNENYNSLWVGQCGGWNF